MHWRELAWWLRYLWKHFLPRNKKNWVRRDSGQSRAHIYDGRERRSVHRKKQTQVSLVFSLLLPLESVFLLGVEFSKKLWSCQYRKAERIHGWNLFHQDVTNHRSHDHWSSFPVGSVKLYCNIYVQVWVVASRHFIGAPRFRSRVGDEVFVTLVHRAGRDRRFLSLPSFPLMVWNQVEALTRQSKQPAITTSQRKS